MIIKNGKTISSVIKGSQVIGAIYKGATLVYEAFKNLVISGIPPLTLTKSKGVDLVDYKIYGYSKQSGTPTPETPIEVVSVGEKTNNLISYPYRDTTTTVNGVTFTDNGDGTITANGTATADANAPFYCHQWSDVNIPAGTYTFKANPLDNTDVNGNRIGQGAIALRKDGTVIVNTGDYGNGQTFTIDGADQIYIALRINAGMTAENLVFKPQLVAGTTAGDYEPYGYKIPVKASGTNIFDGLLQYGDYTGGSNRVSSINYIPVKPNTTYRFSRNNERVYFYDEAKTQLSRVDTGNNGNTVTTPENCVYIRCVWFSLTDTSTVIWINEGTERLEYEPYYEPITTNIYLKEPLRKTLDYEGDYIDFKNSKVVRNTICYSLKNRTWVEQAGTYKFYFVRGVPATISATTRNQYSNYFVVKTIATTADTGIGIQMMTNGILRVRPDLTVYDTVAKWKAYADTQDMYVIYTLATPTEETIQLPNIPTIKGTCILSVDTTLQPSNVEVIYKGKE